MPFSSKSSERSDKLVLAATQLFSRQGYNGTTTREIARLADVSENTLFRHFDHKEDLFWAALRSHSGWLKRCKESLDGIVALDAPEVVLPKIIELLTDTVNYRPELLRLIAVAFLELEWKAEAFCQEQLSPLCATIRRYLAVSIKSGKVRGFEPTMVTASLITVVMMYPTLSRLIDGENPSYSDSREAARAYTKFWLDVLAPRIPALARTIEPTVGQPTT
jgi:AcrR family transcriptional regulator